MVCNNPRQRYAESEFEFYMYGTVPSSPTDGDSGNLDKARARFTETVDLPTPPIKNFWPLILCDTELILTSKVSHPYPDLNES
jgi:hypothetical protein